MAKWLESFELITNSVRVNGDDKALIFEEHSRCVCKPEFAGGPICTDRSCLNFATQTECLECRSTCQNCRFQKKKYANLEVRETSWKGHGLYANEDLKKGQFLMEYLGELISSAELSSRMDGLTDKHLYVLQLKPGNYLDARNKGTIGRFINHSCEPNCTIELWTVNGRIRVGIFALTDIERDAELSFDYKWSRSNRPPTKCHCGTASCRGFLEIMSAQEIEEIKVRKGLWRHKKDDISAMLQLSGGSLSSSDDLNSTDSLSADGASPDNKQTGIKSILKVKADLPANSLFDLRGRLIPERVVGKRLRIWWEGNQAFFEADVLEYVPKSGRYMCHYLADDTTTDEGLSEAASVWSWLDETQNEAVIRKKDISMFADGVAVDEQPYAEQKQLPTTIGESSSNPRDQLIEQSRAVVKVSFNTALHVVHTSWINARQNVDPASLSNRELIWTELFKLLTNYYNVNAKLPNQRDSFAGGWVDPAIFSADMQQVVLFGSLSDVSQARQGIYTAHTAYLANKKSAIQRDTDLLLARQSIVLTCDWRMMPVCRRGGPIVSSFLQHAVDAISAMPFSYDSFLVEQRLLPRVQFNVDATISNATNSQSYSSVVVGAVSDKVRSTLLTHLRGLVGKRMVCSKQIAYSALTLLARYLRFCDDSVVKDYTHLIAAAVVVAMKAHGQFRFRMLRKIVQGSYCQVFSREESNVGHTADSFIPRVLEIEQQMFYRLRYDVYVADYSALICAAGCAHGVEEAVAIIVEEVAVTSARESKKDKHDRHKEKQSRKEKHNALSVPGSTVSAAQRLQLECRALCDEGLELASCLLLQFPSLLLGVPTELVGFTCTLLVGLLTTLLTPHSVARYLVGGEPPSAAMAAVLLPARQNVPLAEWCLEFFGNLVVQALSVLEGVACLADQRDYEGSSMDTLILDCAPKLMIRWIMMPLTATNDVITAPVVIPSIPAAPVRPTMADPSLLVAQSAAAVPIVPGYLLPPPQVPSGPVFLPPMDMSAFAPPPIAPYGYVMPPVVAPVYGYDGYAIYPPVAIPQQYPPPLPTQPLPPPPPPQQPPAPAVRPPIPQLPPVPVRAPKKSVDSSVSQQVTDSAPVKVSKQPTINSAHVDLFKPPCPSHREIDPTQLAIRTRLPWLDGDFAPQPSATGCSLQLADLSDVCALTKTREVYNGAVSVDSLARIGAGHLISRVGTTGDGLETVVPITFRAWPSLKALLREVKKSAVTSAADLGAPNSAVSELCLFQHLHHHFKGTRSNKDVPSVSTCPYLVEPFAVVNVSPAEWHQPINSQLLFGGKFDANHEYLESLKESAADGGDDEDDAYNISTSYSESSKGGDKGLTPHKDSAGSRQTQLSDDWKQDLLYGLNDDARQSTANQVSAIRDKKYSLPDVTLSFLAFAPVHLVLQSLLSIDSSNSGESKSRGAVVHSLSTDFSLQLCRDLLCAADHLIYCGVFLKWLSLDHLYVTTTGRLLIGSLTGAVLASSITKEDSVTSDGVVESDARLKAKAKKGGEAIKRRGDKESSSGIPSNSYYCVAPEVLLGGSPSPESTVYTAGSICAQILTGKTVIKNATSEEKQLQYVYRVLGTPKIVGYKDFEMLPLAGVFGRHIKAEDGTLTESRSRSSKVIRSICPPELLASCSFTSGSTVVAARVSSASGKAEKDSPEETDGGGVVDLLRSALQLMPDRRVMPHDLLELRVFSFALSQASEARVSVEELTQGRFEDEVLYLSGGRNVLVQAMTAESRMLTMQSLVRSVRGSVADLALDEEALSDLDASLQKDLRDVRRDNLLFHLAVDKNLQQLGHLRGTLAPIPLYTDGETPPDEEVEEGYSYNASGNSGQDLQALADARSTENFDEQGQSSRHFVEQPYRSDPDFRRDYQRTEQPREHHREQPHERSTRHRSPSVDRNRDRDRDTDRERRNVRSRSPGGGELDSFGRAVRRRENNRDYSRHSHSRDRDRSDSRDRGRYGDRHDHSQRRRSYSRDRRSRDRRSRDSDRLDRGERNGSKLVPAPLVDPRVRRSSGFAEDNQRRLSRKDDDEKLSEGRRESSCGEGKEFNVESSPAVEDAKNCNGKRSNPSGAADWEQFTDIEPKQEMSRKGNYLEVDTIEP